MFRQEKKKEEVTQKKSAPFAKPHPGDGEKKLKGGGKNPSHQKERTRGREKKHGREKKDTYSYQYRKRKTTPKTHLVMIEKRNGAVLRKDPLLGGGTPEYTSFS